MDLTHAKRFKNQIEYAPNLDSFHRNLMMQKELTDYALNLIRKQSIAPLEQLLLSRQIEPGILVTFHRHFYFRGSSAALNKERKGTKSYAEFHTRLTEFEDLEVKGQFSPEHFTCSSATNRLSGKATRFMLAIVEEVQAKSILLRPLIIGDRIYGGESDLFLYSKNEQRIFSEDIDEFSKMESIDAQKWDINRLKNIPEQQVKKMFAELLNEGNVPKDWGGEKSDLFTTHIHIKGVRASAAFLFKGPSKFHSLTLKDLGANGDQIVRLFEEPADIHIVQHCHYITAEITHHLDAFASRPYSTSYYCTLDGIDTLRILVGYGYI
jgi:hypothetical protein